MEVPVDNAPLGPKSRTHEKFETAWIASTADKNITLHSFRRSKTTHLLNLRFLEDEIAQMDHILYQAGLSLNLPISSFDRLGLRNNKRDAKVPKIDEVITPEFILKLRSLLKEYDEALAAFNKIMTMEINSLLDDDILSSLRSDLSLGEKYKTRLLRVDLGTRERIDPFQRWLYKYLRSFKFWKLKRKLQNNPEDPGSAWNWHHIHYRRHQWLYQDSLLIAEITGRFLTAAFTAVFLIAPLVILSYESSKNVQLAIIAAWILGLSFLVSLFLKVTSFEMIAVAAAYTAILFVFVSNVPADMRTSVT
ncbi:hypothetical protein COCMIDRAFT_38112 [Bipolaris oryzae ATCC 44560]|uniref:DUF6594 domain-containing protein n=1 Tax=Bipolaris oryzae ATCC 44560 TaxID=930090 RepID=W6ZK72_COCMI|nr:uncharacterized protein COCMIDRAFT_38112 [Bipolaris oryzae ATCC 44560]EUC43986.1 hypothetical protein COCMIDRAFT_38112 [Bipolaris oryzae ATCC 44560]